MTRKIEVFAVAAILFLVTSIWEVSQSVTAELRIAAPAVFYASQSGRSTLDQGEGGGNPFASALIELLERSSLSYAELLTDLVTVTKQKSREYQIPEVPAAVGPTEWKLKPVPASAKRVALVFVYADYSDVDATSLPGAERDLYRVAAALREAGFDVQTIIDPTRESLHSSLKRFSKLTEDAEAAVIYLTGHGFEHRDEVYLAPNDYPFDEGFELLPERAVHVPGLKGFLKAKSANLVFFGGCRTIR